MAPQGDTEHLETSNKDTSVWLEVVRLSLGFWTGSDCCAGAPLYGLYRDGKIKQQCQQQGLSADGWSGRCQDVPEGPSCERDAEVLIRTDRNQLCPESASLLSVNIISANCPSVASLAFSFSV